MTDSIFIDIAIVAVTLLALAGSTVITAVSAWKPVDNVGETERWEGGVLVRVQQHKTHSPVSTWVQLFVAMEVAGLLVVAVVSV